MSLAPRTIVYDISILIVGIGSALMLYHFDLVNMVPHDNEVLTYVWSFVAGIFFTSVVTIAPASVALAELAPHGTLWGIALSGGLGAMVGDIAILYFLKEHVAYDVEYFMRAPFRARFRRLMKHRITRGLLMVIGAVIIVSPLPDELGLALMGLSRISLGVLAPLSFVLNFIGVYGIVWLALSLH